MQLILFLVVLVIAAPLILYMGPVFLYMVPLIAIGLVFSFLNKCVRHASRTSAH